MARFYVKLVDVKYPHSNTKDQLTQVTELLFNAHGSSTYKFFTNTHAQ